LNKKVGQCIQEGDCTILLSEDIECYVFDRGISSHLDVQSLGTWGSNRLSNLGSLLTILLSPFDEFGVLLNLLVTLQPLRHLRIFVLVV
jgi:hypothetical protein